MSLSASILLSILANETDAGDISREVRTTKAEYFLPLTDGTGTNQAQLAWSDRLTIQQDGTADVQMRLLADDRGSVAFTAIKAIYVKNNSEASQVDLAQGSAIQNSWGSIGFTGDGESSTVIAPGGVLFLSSPTASGLSVTASSDRLFFAGTPGENIDIILIGEGSIT